MTDIEIIKSLQGGKVAEYESFLNGSTQEKSDTKDVIISLVANKVLKAKVDEKTMNILIKIGDKLKAQALLNLHELSEKLGCQNLKLRVISNKDTLPSKPGKKYEDERWYNRFLTEINVAENEYGKLALLDEKGEPVLNEWFDNICLVTYQSHPCYPEHIELGIIVERDYKFAALVSKGSPKPILRKNLFDILKKGECMLTLFDKTQFLFEYANQDDKRIYQAFWGYGRDWAIDEDDLEVKHDERLSYHENIMASSGPYNRIGTDTLPPGDYFIPRYIYYDGERKFYTYSQYEFEEFIKKYEEDKKNNNLERYIKHYTI